MNAMTRGERGTVLRLSLLVAVMFLGLLVPRSASAAGLKGAAVTGSVPVSTLTWAAVASPTNTKPYPTSPLAVTFNPNGTQPPPPGYFWAINSGSSDLTGATITLSVTPSHDTVLEVCSTTWNTTANTCPGGTITNFLETTGTTSTTVTIAATPPGTLFQLRARVTTAIAAKTTATINISVTRAEARAATTTNS